MAGGWPESVGGRGESVSISRRAVPRKAQFKGGRSNSVGGIMNLQVAGMTLLVVGAVS